MINYILEKCATAFVNKIIPFLLFLQTVSNFGSTAVHINTLSALILPLLYYPIWSLKFKSKPQLLPFAKARRNWNYRDSTPPRRLAASTTAKRFFVILAEVFNQMKIFFYLEVNIVKYFDYL